MPSTTQPLGKQSSTRKASTTKQEMSPALTRSRSRKVQPILKQRGEAFLAQAAADADSTAKKDVGSNKRKRGSNEVQAKQSQLPVLETSSRSFNQVDRGSAASGLRAKQAQEHLSGWQDLSSGPPLDEEDAEQPLSTIQPKKAVQTKVDDNATGPAEKRLRLFRKKAPITFNEKLNRATSQRMIVIGRTRSDRGGYPQEDIDIVGTTGNIYTVTVGLIPTCTCPDSLKGNECKHKVYALHTVLKAPEHLQYQRALLTSELHEIFANAPPSPTDDKSSEDTDGKRKPTVDAECPICYMDFDEEHNELVWCKAACGNNMHKECFERWAKSQAGQTVKCVYCRTPWQTDPGDVHELVRAGSVGSDGYVNVADQMGMTRERDTSTYHQWSYRQAARRRG